MNRKFSNTQVNNAGIVLCNPQSNTPEEYLKAQEILTYWRTIHASPINTFQSSLKENIFSLGYNDSIIAQRVKRSVSIVSKLQRFPNMKLSTMQDIAGLRAIVGNIDQVRELEDCYRNTNFGHKLKDEKDYINDPAPSGYRGIHLVYQYKNDENIEANNLRVELQIRTKLQHTWATTVETMGTFLQYSLKSSQGPYDWLNYFSLVSAGFAIIENCPLPTKFESMSESEIFEKIVEETMELNVSEKLRAFTVAADHITQSKVNSKYNLITLNLEKRRVTVKNYKENQLEQANIEYSHVEGEINKGAPIQSVLVSTETIDSLREAYPSYFLDTRAYLDKLNYIYSLVKK